MAKGSFTLRPGALEDTLKKLAAVVGVTDTAMRKKMETVVKAVHTTATARREKIAKHRTAVTKKWSKAYRVSNPDAPFGVPFKTGNLQSSIKKEVFTRGGKTIGRIYVDKEKAPYGVFVEFGTSRMRARPFMRPALMINKAFIEHEIGRPMNLKDIS